MEVKLNAPQKVFIFKDKEEKVQKKQFSPKEKPQIKQQKQFNPKISTPIKLENINIKLPEIKPIISDIKIQTYVLKLKKPIKQVEKIHKNIQEKTTNKILKDEIDKVSKNSNAAVGLKNTKDEIIPKNLVGKSINSALAIKKFDPDYPRRAKKKGINGYVKYDFKINYKGEVFDIVLTSSSPKGVFEKEALKAIKKWKFNSFDKNLKYQKSSVTFNFKINK